MSLTAAIPYAIATIIEAHKPMMNKAKTPNMAPFTAINVSGPHFLIQRRQITKVSSATTGVTTREPTYPHEPSKHDPNAPILDKTAPAKTPVATAKASARMVMLFS